MSRQPIPLPKRTRILAEEEEEEERGLLMLKNKKENEGLYFNRANTLWQSSALTDR
jgi:hypothetical protein